MKFKAKEMVYFFPEYEQDLTTSFESYIKKPCRGEIKHIQIDEDNNVYYSIQTYMLYSPYKFFKDIPEEYCFSNKKDLQIAFVNRKLNEINAQKKSLELLLKTVKESDEKEE